jgi:hypothetical protein
MMHGKRAGQIVPAWDRARLLSTFPHDLNAAGLGAFISLLDHESDPEALLEVVEVTAHQAVSMEVHLQPVLVFYESVIGEQAYHVPMGLHFVRLLVSPLLSSEFQELPLGLIERLSKGLGQVFVRMVLGGRAADDDLVPGHPEIDAHMVEVAGLMASLGHLHHQMATGEFVIGLVEVGNPFSDQFLVRFSELYVPQGDFRLDLHVISSCPLVYRDVGLAKVFEPARAGRIALT